MTLSKRAWDRRILHVDLSPALRVGDFPNRVVSVTATPTVQGSEALTITDISIDGAAVNFLASGGNRGARYNVVIRCEVPSSPVQMIEAFVGLEVQ